MIDFSVSSELESLRREVSSFIEEVVIPAEARDVPGHGLDDALRSELQDEAKQAGLFAPHVDAEFGGLGLDHREQSIIFEEAGYSLLGPQALNCAAPDEGNMHMLSRIATAKQKEEYLRPLANGDIRSCFAMTEPAPGAGSDPAMLNSTATKVAGGWSINGRKWFTTGANGAGFTICMALTSERIEGGRGATMFLIDSGNPGMQIERVIGASDRSFPGGHAELAFEDCFVARDAVIGEVGEGYSYAQVRLAPARLTHCMRWLGIARRALDIALDHASGRTAFGSSLVEQGQIQKMIADSEIDIHSSRLMIWNCAWKLDMGENARNESSMAKVHVAEAVYRVVDRAIQICGSLGVSEELPLSRFLNEVRPFRIYDGPSETHIWAIARRSARQRTRDSGGNTR